MNLDSCIEDLRKVARGEGYAEDLWRSQIATVLKEFDRLREVESVKDAIQVHAGERLEEARAAREEVAKLLDERTQHWAGVTAAALLAPFQTKIVVAAGPESDALGEALKAAHPLDRPIVLTMELSVQETHALKRIAELAPAISNDLKWILVHDVGEAPGNEGLSSAEPDCTCGPGDPCPGCRWRQFDSALSDLARIRKEIRG